MLKAQQVSHSGTFSEEAFETFRKQIVVYEKLKRFADAVEDVKETLRLQKSMLPRNSDIIVHTKKLLEEWTEKMQRTTPSSVCRTDCARLYPFGNVGLYSHRTVTCIVKHFVATVIHLY
jgi:hypothetical protein